MFAINMMSRFMQNPTKQHSGPAKRILKYIAGTLEFGVWYTCSTKFKLQGYSDSDWVSSLDDKKSTSRSVFTLSTNAITWYSKKQEIITLLTAEAEYITATSLACQAI